MQDTLANFSKDWYTFRCHTRREKKAVELLKERIMINDMDSMFGEVLIPIERIVEIKKGQRKHSERLFFPGYIFIEMISHPRKVAEGKAAEEPDLYTEKYNEAYNLVIGTDYILNIGGGKKQPVPLTSKEIAKIRKNIDLGSQQEIPKTVFSPGEKIRVISGPFKDFSGMVEDVNYERNSLKVAVSILGRSTPVELDFDQVEKI